MASVEPDVSPSAEFIPQSGTGSVEPTLSSLARRPGLRREERQFEDCFLTLANVAYRVAYRLLGNRPEAEDVTQEALTRAYQRWQQVRDHSEPWVARVASNLALDVIRRGRRRPVEGLSDRDEPAARDDDGAIDRVDLVRVLRAMPRRQRQVVVLRYLADLSELDTAAELGISIGAVKKHASRGLAALRERSGLQSVGDELTPDAEEEHDRLPEVDDVRTP